MLISIGYREVVATGGFAPKRLVSAPCWKQSTGYIPEDLQARHVKYVLNKKNQEIRSNATSKLTIELCAYQQESEDELADYLAQKLQNRGEKYHRKILQTEIKRHTLVSIAHFHLQSNPAYQRDKPLLLIKFGQQ